MGCSDISFYEFVNKYKHRKTVPKKEAIKLMIKMVESCEHPLHYSACYMEGDEPTKLADKWVEENKNISKFNQHVNKIIKNVRKAI
jgi:hypothetical protein